MINPPAHPRDPDADADATAAQRPRVGVDLNSVPLSIISGRIFDFLAHAEPLEFLRNGFSRSKYQNKLKPLASVCRDWRAIAQTRLSDTKCISCTLETKATSDKELQRLLKQAEALGPQASELTIVMGAVYEAGILTERLSSIDAYQNQQWWETLLTHFPNVVRLDLTLVSFRLLPMVLEIASRLCPTVKSLGLLCGPMRVGDQNAPTYSVAAKALREALERWYVSNGGLRVLTMPTFVGHEASAYDDFFFSVAANCPQIEYLMATSSHHSIGFYDEEWPELSVDAWTAFCRKCPLIRELSWTIAPWTEEHVNEFTASPKLRLRELTLVTVIGDWWYKDLSVLGRIFDAMPRLTSLSVDFVGNPEREWHEPDEDDEDEDDEPWLTHPGKIMRFVAENCPKLQRIKVEDSSDNHVHGITADAVDALVKMKSLCSLELPRVTSIRDNTLAEMLRCMLDSPSCETRFVELNVNDYTYNAILELLQFMAQQPPERFEGMKLELSVAGSDRDNENGATIMPTPNRKLKPKAFEKAVETVKKIHTKSLSYIVAEVAITRVSNRVLQYVEEFHLLLNVSSQDVKDFKATKAADRADYNAGYEEIEDGDVGGILFQKEERVQYY